MVRIRLVDPSLRAEDGRIVPSLADVGLDPLVQAGETIDVPESLAGRGPEDGDLGTGMLAQTDVWALDEGQAD
jgi:hypothetical protein